MHIHQRHFLSVIGAAGLGLVSCGGPGETGILVNLGMVPTATQKITLKTTLDGQQPSSIDTSELAAGTTRFGLSVPANLSGSLSIELTAIDVDTCIQGTAQTSLSLPTERGKEIVADFMTLTPRKCDNPPTPPSCAKNTLCPYAFSPVNKSLFGVFAIAPNDIWAVGSVGTVVHWDGQAWRTVISSVLASHDLYDVWASGPKDVWVVGGGRQTLVGGIALHYDGTTWTSVPNNAANDFNGIHGLSANEIYIVGDNSTLGGPGEFWRWNGTSLAKMSNSENGQLWRVFAVSSTEIWAMGFQNTLIKHSGTSANYVSLTSIGATATTEFRHMWGTGSNNLFLVGSNGFAAHYTGTWSRMTQGATTSTLYAVQGTTATGTVYALGNNGWLFTSDPPYTAFTAVANPPTNSTSLRELSIAQDGSAWVVGLNGFLAQLGTK